jgi:hypothetical protein
MPFRFVSVVLAAAPAAASVEPSPFMERFRAAHIVQIRTDLKAGGGAIGEVKVDPMIYSLGLGYRS